MLDVALPIQIVDPYLAAKISHYQSRPDKFILAQEGGIAIDPQSQPGAGLAKRLRERPQQILPGAERWVHLSDTQRRRRSGQPHAVELLPQAIDRGLSTDSCNHDSPVTGIAVEQRARQPRYKGADF